MPKNILIMSLTRMGDLIQSTPLISSLRKRYPEAKITLLVSSDFVEFAKRANHIDDIIVFNLRQFNKKGEKGELKSWVEVYQYLEEFLKTLSDRSFSKVYNLSHSKLSALMIHYLKIPEIVGFHCNRSGDRKTDHPWLQYFGIEPFNRLYNSYNLADIYMLSGDGEPGSEELSIAHGPDDALAAAEVLGDLHGNEELVIGIQAGSSLEGRRWSVESFSTLGDLICSRLNAKIVLLGVASESEIASKIVEGMEYKERVLDLTGKTSITQLIGVLKRCSYLVTNDTGTMHIAAALKVPIVGLFFAHAHPHETGPFGEGHIVFQARIHCAPCSYGVSCNDIVCVQKVPPMDVFSYIENHVQMGNWKLDSRKVRSNEMNVFESVFDYDGLINFKPLLKNIPTDMEVYSRFYRQLWVDSLIKKPRSDAANKESLRNLSDTIREDFQVDGLREVILGIGEDFNLFRELRSIARTGIKVCSRLSESVAKNQVTADKLKLFASSIEEIDEKIDRLGMTHPQIKPISDIFDKRKENLDGDDIERLAKETQNCYEKLEYECKRMVEIMESAFKAFNISREDYTEVSSSKAAVPAK
jgi:ADP-heptose:LPS heptosyltransferase